MGENSEKTKQQSRNGVTREGFFISLEGYYRTRRRMGTKKIQEKRDEEKRELNKEKQ